MNKLLVFARRFPYGRNEPYLETEIKYLAAFDEVHVFSLSVEKDAIKREVYQADNVYYHTVPYQSIFKYIFVLIGAIFSSHLYKELGKLLRTKRLNFNALKQLFIYLAKSKVDGQEIEAIISRENIVTKQDKVVIYSYRFDYAAYMLAKIEVPAKKVLKISRAHGIDLYEYRQSSNYLPFREYILKHLDQLFLISKENVNYAKKNYPEYSDKFKLSYLGTSDLGFKMNALTSPIKVLSVSGVVPVKRVDLIYQSLVKASEKRPIHWTHYGADTGFTKLKELVSAQNTNPNLTIDLKGHVDNQILLEILQKEPYHLFINLSTSEGLPVSIMEAMSLGIPAIATNAGGTYEIVMDNYTGKLVEIETTAENVANKIEEVANLNASDYAELRENARTHWTENFSAEQNYQIFVHQLLQLLN